MDIMHDYWGSGMGFGMWIFWILFIAVIVVLIRMVFGTRSDASPPSSASATHSHDTTSHDTGSQDDALEILRQRYARGEIDKNEFETMQQELNKQD